jgi:histidinol-phosphate/aromatic aminotransferase/cobyric acid decarboxylase-like protein
MNTPDGGTRKTLVATHGGRNAFRGANVLPAFDFSTSLNAFGPADVVRRAVAEASIDEYPDPSSRAARHAAARSWNVSAKEVAFGAGSAEIIHAACLAYITHGDHVVIDTPAFAEYERSARLCGGTVSQIARADVQTLCDAIRVRQPRLVFVCSPSSPDGRVRTIDELKAIADGCETTGAVLLLDQAYDAFAQHPLGTPALSGHPAVLHVRSLTKEHAIAGIRAAFAVGPPTMIAALESARVPWSASSVAQAAALACFSRDAAHHASTTIGTLRNEARRVKEACQSMGYAVEPSDTHYFLVRVGSGATAQRTLLDDAGILVRDCASFGLPSHVRVAARKPGANDALLDALDHLSSQIRT